MVIATAAGLLALAARAAAPADACWVQVNYDTEGALPQNVPAPAVIAVDASSANPEVLLIATRPGAVFRSRDGGRRWSGVTAGLDGTLGWINIGPNPKSIRFDPRRPGRAWLGIETMGAFVSDDDGTSWRRQSRGLTHYRLNAISFGFPGGGSTVLLGSDGGLDRWEEAQGRWSPERSGLPGGGTVSSIASANRRVNVLIHYASEPGDQGGIFWSVGASRRWRRSAGQPAGQVTLGSGPNPPTFPAANGRSVAIDPRDPHKMLAGTFAGILRSTDSGESWTLVHRLATAPYAIAYDLTRPGQVYAGGRHLMLLSDDSGLSWRPFERGLAGRVGRHSASFFDPAAGRNLVTTFDMVSTSRGDVFAATDAGLFRAESDPLRCPASGS